MALSFSVPDTELSLTLHNRRAQLIDQIFKGTVFLDQLKRRGGVKMEDGGLEIVQPLRFAKNSSTGSFSGYDILDTTPQDTETSGRWPWANLFATIAIAWDEQKKNQGRGKLIDLMNQKSDDAATTIRDLLNTQLLAAAPAAGSKDVISLLETVQADPTTNPARTASIGNLSDANTWWRNKATNGGAFSVSDMTAMYNDVSDASEYPEFILTSQTVFQYYENSLTGQIRYNDTKMADAGFQNLMFKATPIAWDPLISVSTSMFFLNFKYLNLCIMKGADFVTTDFIEPDNQAAKVAKILFMGNLVANGRRRLGVLHTITAPA